MTASLSLSLSLSLADSLPVSLFCSILSLRIHRLFINVSANNLNFLLLFLSLYFVLSLVNNQSVTFQIDFRIKSHEISWGVKLRHIFFLRRDLKCTVCLFTADLRATRRHVRREEEKEKKKKKEKQEKPLRQMFVAFVKNYWLLLTQIDLKWVKESMWLTGTEIHSDYLNIIHQLTYTCS